MRDCINDGVDVEISDYIKATEAKE